MQVPLRRCFAALFLTAAGAAFLPLAAQTLHQRQPPPAAADGAVPQGSLPPERPGKPVVPSGTSFQVEVARHYPMKVGQAVEGRLLHPIYADGALVIPEATLLRGAVVSLSADKQARWHGRLRGDFTPFHTPEVQFGTLILPSGELPISAAAAANGAPVLRLSAPGATPRRSIIARAWERAKSHLHDQVAFFVDPGLGDRVLWMFYRELPLHPEQIAAHTAWSFELSAPLALPEGSANAQPALPAAAQPGRPETWSVHALLTGGLTSATARPGDAVSAQVTEPVFDSAHALVVPQGSTLLGRVTSAKAARSFGRNGKLRFTFQQVVFPAGSNRAVEGALAGATTAQEESLSLDAEGTITPRNKANAIAPLLLTMLAGRALDEDGNLTAQTGVASNGFGLAGRVAGLAAGSRNLAAGIGFYAAGLSFYDNFLRPGHNVVFPKDTRIEIETTPLRAPVLKPAMQQAGEPVSR